MECINRNQVLNQKKQFIPQNNAMSVKNKGLVKILASLDNESTVILLDHSISEKLEFFNSQALYGLSL
uniref:Uncharacterized protein n=1 Tax=Megaselia scalaris TaxID=36166 RepID=T1H5A2_MEGSC